MNRLTPERFAREIGCNGNRLERLHDSVPAYYREETRAKPGGGSRDIVRSTGIVRALQRRIHGRYLQDLEWPGSTHGVRGRGHIANAKRHLGKPYHFVTDVFRFFPSISYQRVYDAFTDSPLRFSADAARLATRLTTHEGRLPQGLHTSPRLADLVFSPVDDALARLCKRHGITYTRYVDDLTFSSQHPFEEKIEAIKSLVSEGGFRLHEGEKTYYKKGPVEVTGVSVANNTLRAPERVHEKRSRMEPGSRAHRSITAYIDQIERAAG